MKYCLKPSDDVSKLPKGLVEVFLERPLRLSKLKQLLEEKNVSKIFCSKSCLQRIPSKSKKYLQEKNVQLELQSLKGKPLSLSAEKIMEFNELRKDGLSYRKIAERIKSSKSTMHYLAKYAKRTKLKNNGKTMSSI